MKTNLSNQSIHKLISNKTATYKCYVYQSFPVRNMPVADIHLGKLLLVYSPGHAGVKGNDQADRHAGKTAIINGLPLERFEVLRCLRQYLWAQSQGHHTIDRLEERGVKRGNARRSSLKGRERAIVSQTNTGAVSKATLGKPLRDGVERIWTFLIA